MTEVSDNYGTSVASVYYVRNLLESRTWSGGGIDPARVEFDYDARGQLSELRRFADATGGTCAGRTVYTRDDRGLTTGITHLDAVDNVFADYGYVYDLAAQLQQDTHHGGFTLGSGTQDRHQSRGGCCRGSAIDSSNLW